MVKATLQGCSVGRRNQQTREGESEIYNSIFVVTFNGLLGRLNRANLALVCALKGNQMLFWEFLNVCIEVVIG